MQLCAANWPRGCLQVYTGDGKGKTTAAFGLVLRAAARGLACYVGQFMKNYPYGELAGCALLGDRIKVEQFGSPECIPFREKPDPDDVARAIRGLDRCAEILESGRYRIVVMDEVNVAVHFGLLEEEQLLRVADLRPQDVELVCTGRWATPRLLERADLVTEMRCVKHYYDTLALQARDGIER